MPDESRALQDVARRHGLSEAAVRALVDALAAGRGGGAQWSHPDLGGMGQWMRGGLLQIGAMFDDGLKARIGAALADLAAAGRERSEDPSVSRDASWWPDDLGIPAATGAQNGMRYAAFPARHRLAVERDGRCTVNDTGARRLTGIAQAQGPGQHLTFSGPEGRVTLDDLTIVS